MMLVLICALCVTGPVALTGSPAPRLALVDRLTLDVSVRNRLPQRAAPLLLTHTLEHGAGNGGHSEHDHMGPMWIVMGIMMAVMMIGMGVYFMRHASTGQLHGAGGLVSPAQLALPISGARPGGG